jgi:signal transduction histidine kinase/CheY-like chemotaxis protein
VKLNSSPKPRTTPPEGLHGPRDGTPSDGDDTAKDLKTEVDKSEPERTSAIKPSNSSAAQLVARRPCASERPLTGCCYGIAFDSTRLNEEEATIKTEPVLDTVDKCTRHWTAELDQLKRANADLASEIAAMEHAEDGLKEASRRKDEFLAMLAHELRNPLASIQSGLAILAQSGAAPQTLEVARGLIGRQVGNISRLIDDLLDLSRITHGKMALDKQTVSLQAAVQSAIESCLPLIQSRQHVIELNVPEEPVLLEVDPGRLEQVLSNLLNNAAKYTERGGRLSISASLESGEAVVRIKDTGIGMTHATLSKVFDLFTQENGSLDRFQGGLGIGLTIVKTLVELHGGTVKAESDGPGRGSEFTVRLPTSSGIVVVPHVSDATYPRGERLRILVVDDNMETSDGLTLLLQLSGHEVRAAYRGDEVLPAAKSFLPEAVLLDIGLPGMDGIEVARRVRAEKSLARVCLIAVSGYGREEDRVRSREAGFDHHLLKPVDMKMLQALLAKVFCVSREAR